MAQNNQNKSHKAWTSQDNTKLAEIIVDLVSKGMKFGQAYKEAAEVLGRSEFAVEKQWRTNLKQKYVSKIVKNTKLNATKAPKKANIPGTFADLGVEKRQSATVPVQTVADVLANDVEKKWVQSALGKFGITPMDLSKIDVADFKALSTALANIENDTKFVSPNAPKAAYEGREKAAPKEGTTKLAALRKSIETFESEKFKVLDSGKDGLEYIVINHEEDKGYLVKVDAEKVVDCNCPHHTYRQIDGKGVICKHMLKVAFDKNLEVF